jgi:hypothetical protein
MGKKKYTQLEGHGKMQRNEDRNTRERRKNI